LTHFFSDIPGAFPFAQKCRPFSSAAIAFFWVRHLRLSSDFQWQEIVDGFFKASLFATFFLLLAVFAGDFQFVALTGGGKHWFTWNAFVGLMPERMWFVAIQAALWVLLFCEYRLFAAIFGLWRNKEQEQETEFQWIHVHMLALISAGFRNLQFTLPPGQLFTFYLLAVLSQIGGRPFGLEAVGCVWGLLLIFALFSMPVLGLSFLGLGLMQQPFENSTALFFPFPSWRMHFLGAGQLGPLSATGFQLLLVLEMARQGLGPMGLLIRSKLRQQKEEF
jgi:hypothetical protein